MKLELNIHDADGYIIDITITADDVTLDYDDGGKFHQITLTRDQFKQIWRLLAHFNQIQEAESCKK